MLSRLALRKIQELPAAACVAYTTHASPPRPIRPEYPTPVRHIFIPESWFQFFYPKTGVTGPYAFGIGLSTYLISKEYYIIEHEFWIGVSLLMVGVIGYRKFGTTLAQFLDGEVDKVEANLQATREAEIKAHEDVIAGELQQQKRLEGQKIILDAKKENIAMQLEAIYRERIAHVYSEVKKRLDYQVQIENVERRVAQKHMIQWIINSVLKAITPEQEKATLQQCITDLEALAVKA